MSFFKSDLSTVEPVYIGLDNFKMMMEDEVFRKALLIIFGLQSERFQQV